MLRQIPVFLSQNRSGEKFTGLSDDALEEFLGILRPNPSLKHTRRSGSGSTWSSGSSSSCATSAGSSRTSTRSHPYRPSYYAPHHSHHHVNHPSTSTVDVLNQSFDSVPCYQHRRHRKYLTIDSSVFNLKQYTSHSNEPSTSLSFGQRDPLGKLTLFHPIK